VVNARILDRAGTGDAVFFAVHSMDKETTTAVTSGSVTVLEEGQEEENEIGVEEKQEKIEDEEKLSEAGSFIPPVGTEEESPLRRQRRFPTTPSSYHSDPRDEVDRAKSPVESLSILSDFNGSEDSHAERRFLRHYEELESYCSGKPPLPLSTLTADSFPDFITPWYLRRVNYGPCKAGDIVDLIRFLRPSGTWTCPFRTSSILDPFLSSSLEKAVYPTLEQLNPSQSSLLRTLHHFIFSAYDYAQGIFFPSQGTWDDDRRDVTVDALNLYVDDVVALVDFLRRHGSTTSLRVFVKERTERLSSSDTKRTFFFAQGGDSRRETEEYVYNMFLAVLGLWTVGEETSSEREVDISPGVRRLRFDYAKNFPFREGTLENVSLLRETFGVLATPLRGAEMGIEWVRPLQDFDAAVILKREFQVLLTRDLARHLSVEEGARTIYVFCDEAVVEGDSLARLEGNCIAK
jgi:hypothetical protein